LPFTFHPSPLSYLSPFTSYLKFKLRTLFLRWIYSYVDKAFYVGTHNKAYYLRHGLKEEQLVYAPHAVDNERFFDSEERQYEKKARVLRRELDIPDEAKVILFAGKFEPKKNPGILIDAILQLNEKVEENREAEKLDKLTFHPSPFTFHLILVGSGILESQLRQKAKDRDDITFLSFQNQSLMPVVYRLGDIFCLPSQGPGETWGLAINEAMASGRPVIASNKCGGAIDLLNKMHIFDAQSITSCFTTLKNIINSTDLPDKSKNINEWQLEKIVIALENSL
jgi:glycosyltransferase involved in cell wall biosynthesis